MNGTYFNCPRCGLTISPKTDWLTVDHCPRCLAHRHAAVSMFASTLPTHELYAIDARPGQRRSDPVGGLADAGSAASEGPDELRRRRRRKLRELPQDRPAA
jgi:hypothetical protein